jgi:hypothetical protein
MQLLTVNGASAEGSTASPTAAVRPGECFFAHQVPAPAIASVAPRMINTSAFLEMFAMAFLV